MSSNMVAVISQASRGCHIAPAQMTIGLGWQNVSVKNVAIGARIIGRNMTHLITGFGRENIGMVAYDKCNWQTNKPT